MSAAPRQPIRLKDYKVPPYLIPNTKLRFELGEESTEVQSILTLQRNPLAKEEDRLLRLHGEGIELLELKLNGALLREADYQKDKEFLTFKNFPDEGELSIRTRIRPQDNTTLEGLYKSNELFCTQCEAEGFRHITFFLDRPDVLSRYTTTIVGDKQTYPTLLSNGNLSTQEACQMGATMSLGKIHFQNQVTYSPLLQEIWNVWKTPSRHFQANR